MSRKTLPDKLEADALALEGVSPKGFAKIIKHLRDAAFRLRYLEAQTLTLSRDEAPRQR